MLELARVKTRRLLEALRGAATDAEQKNSLFPGDATAGRDEGREAVRNALAAAERTLAALNATADVKQMDPGDPT